MQLRNETRRYAESMHFKKVTLQAICSLGLAAFGLATVSTAEAASFGSQTINTQSPPQSFKVVNPGSLRSITITVTISGTDFVATSGSTCAVGYPMILGANSSCSLNVAFFPRSVGPKTGTIYSQDIASVGGYKSPLYALTGTGVAPSPTAAPILAPGSGTYTSPQLITITATAGASIFYTLDGSTPTTASARYANAIAVSMTDTLKAIAAASGRTQSAVSTAIYTIITPTATPTLAPGSGTYTGPQLITIGATSGASIFYTLDGSTPTTASARYSSPISIGMTETLKVVAVAPGHSQSAVSTALYTILTPTGAPTLTPGSGTYTGPQLITINAMSGASIFYTLDGSAPTTASARYTNPITISMTETLKAIAVTSGSAQSVVSTAQYTILVPTPAQWQSVSIPNLPAGSTLQQLWSGQRGTVFVWSRRSKPGTDIPEARLYRTTDGGVNWNLVLTLADSDASAVFGPNTSDVFVSAIRCPLGYAATCGTGRGVQIFRSVDGGNTWVQQALPVTGGVGAGSIGGRENDIFTAVSPWSGGDIDGGQFLHFDGKNWDVQFTDQDGSYIAAFYPTPTMAFIQKDQIYSPTCWGHWLYTGAWSFVPSGFDFCDVSPAWGMRDAQGALSLYATGTNNFANGVKIWKFTETSPGSISGAWGGKNGYVFSDGSTYNCGYGAGVWGSSPKDVWAVGSFNAGGSCSVLPGGEGRIYRFDGTAWGRVTTPFDPLPLIVEGGLTGTAADDVWVALVEGRLLHYSPGSAPTTAP
jgi:hypothetical protein